MAYPHNDFSAHHDSGALPAFCHDFQNWVSTKSVFANSYFVVAEKCWLLSLKGWWQDSLASEIIWISKLKMPCVCHMWVVERCSFLLSLQDPYYTNPFLFYLDSLCSHILLLLQAYVLFPLVTELITFLNQQQWVTENTGETFSVHKYGLVMPWPEMNI